MYLTTTDAQPTSSPRQAYHTVPASNSALRYLPMTVAPYDFSLDLRAFNGPDRVDYGV